MMDHTGLEKSGEDIIYSKFLKTSCDKKAVGELGFLKSIIRHRRSDRDMTFAEVKSKESLRYGHPAEGIRETPLRDRLNLAQFGVAGVSNG